MLHLKTQHLQAIQTHAQQTYPHECCGLLLGSMTAGNGGWQKTVADLQPAANTWEMDKGALNLPEQDFSSQRRYWISSATLMETQKYARSLGWDIIGIYHSHPDHAAIPSECDRQWAWPQYSYVIVGVDHGVPQDCQSWVLDDNHAFEPETIRITDRSAHPAMR